MLKVLLTVLNLKYEVVTERAKTLAKIKFTLTLFDIMSNPIGDAVTALVESLESSLSLVSVNVWHL